MTPSNRLDLMHDQVYVHIRVLLHVITVKFLIVYSLPWYIYPILNDYVHIQLVSSYYQDIKNFIINVQKCECAATCIIYSTAISLQYYHIIYPYKLLFSPIRFSRLLTDPNILISVLYALRQDSAHVYTCCMCITDVCMFSCFIHCNSYYTVTISHEV